MDKFGNPQKNINKYILLRNVWNISVYKLDSGDLNTNVTVFIFKYQ